MESFSTYILTAFALVFVIEGLIYAIFPDAVRRMMALAIEMPSERLRTFGFFMAVMGFCLVWLLQKI